MKATIVPEDQRAAIYNVFRLPLNALVLVFLIGDFSTEVSFLATALLLMVAFALQLLQISRAQSEEEESQPEEEPAEFDDTTLSSATATTTTSNDNSLDSFT